MYLGHVCNSVRCFHPIQGGDAERLYNVCCFHPIQDEFVMLVSCKLFPPISKVKLHHVCIMFVVPTQFKGDLQNVSTILFSPNLRWNCFMFVSERKIFSCHSSLCLYELLIEEFRSVMYLEYLINGFKFQQLARRLFFVVIPVF